jgi:hypothetical protein
MVTASSSPGGNGVFSDEVEVANGSADVELALSNGAAPLPGGASGTVVDDATGRPITDFSADRWPYVPYGEALRPGPGRFRFDGMPLGRSKLRFTAIGYEPAVVEVDVRGGANQAEPFVVRLGAGLSAFGRVIADPPLPPGRRLAWWSVDDSQFGPSSEPVGADGTFRIAGLKPGRYRVLSMRSEGEVQTGIALASRDDRIVEIPASAAGQPLEVELVRAGVLILSPRPAAPNPSVAAPAGPRPPSTDGATRTVRLIVRRPGGAVLSDAKVDAANFGLHAVVVAAPGPIVIRVEAEDGRSTDQVAEIPEGPGVGMASVTLP